MGLPRRDARISHTGVGAIAPRAVRDGGIPMRRYGGPVPRVSRLFAGLLGLGLCLALLAFVPNRAFAAGMWTVSSCDYSLLGVSFPDAAHGWAVGQGTTSGVGVVLRTTNGGASWTHQDFPEPLRAISCPDSSHGWAVGDGGTILAMTATKNGGTQWIPQDWDMRWQGIAPDRVVLTGVHFSDDLHGWAVGLEWVTYYVGNSYEYMVVIKTDDGGKTWTQTQQTMGLSNVALQTASIDSIDAVHAWVVLNGAVVSTVDGGSTWRWGIPAQPGLSDYSLRGAHFEDASHGWAVGWRTNNYPFQIAGAVFVTDDGGLTWSVQGEGLATNVLQSVSFSDA